MKKTLLITLLGFLTLGLATIACKRNFPLDPLPLPATFTSTISPSFGTPTSTFTPGCESVTTLTSVSIPAPNYFNQSNGPDWGPVIIGTSPTPTSTFTPIPTITPIVYGGHPHSFVVIRTLADWNNYCLSAGSPTIPPAPIDFTKQMIISGYVCSGYCQGWTAALSSLCWQPGLIIVNEIDTYECAPECADPPLYIESQCNPSGFAYAVPQSNLPVEFLVSPQSDCSTNPLPSPMPTVVTIP